ncbi:SCO0607 family lipoprotein [Dactylosporangium siamense]|uniref:Lipoprotein n=1 Tax=Dactylosporangium siamense TaxID=685454 RepID=A0A919PDR3_9ACTN|nr:hypothetical protein [Dactylosporangium siamense]GIG42322.1 hypothetical protein Dsi01nite_003630 [Dactylosporangium siamense]
MTRLGVLLLLTALLVTGCSLKERVCGSGEHPVKAVGNTTGRTCVRDGADPPAGYVPYPAGKVPKYLDDEWDRYWSDKVLDERGNLISPAPVTSGT